MKGKNEIRNVVICKYDQDKTKVFVFTKDGRVKERPYDEIKEDLEKILEPKIQNLIKNDIELQDDIKKLEEAKSVAAKYGNDLLQEQLELQAKEIEQLARRRAIQSLINTDTLYIVSSTEFIENFNNFTERSVGALIKRKQSSDGNYYNNQTGKPSIEEVIEEELERTKSTGENAEEKQKTKEKRKNEGQQFENSSDSEQADKKEEESKTEEAAEKTDSTGEEDSQENDTEQEESREKSATSNGDEENGYQKTKKKTSDFQKGGTRTTSSDADKTEQKETNEESDNGSQEQEEQDSNENAEQNSYGYQETANEESDNGSQEQEEQDSNETAGNDNDSSQEEANEESDNGSQEQEEQDSNENAGNDNDSSQEEANEESDNGSQEQEEQDSNETAENDNDGSQEETNEDSDNGSQEQEEQDSNETAGNDNDGSQENSGEESNEEGSNEENNGDDDFDFSEYDFDDNQPIDGYDEDAFDDDFDNENEDENDNENENDDDNDRTTSPKKENIIKRLWKKIKRSPIGKKITAVIVSAALIFGIGGGLYSCSKRQTREGVMNNSNIVTMNDSEDAKNSTSGIIIVGDNSSYNNCTVKQLLDVTTSQVQKESMSNLQKSIIGFNESFADAHTGSYQNAAGETVDVRAALSFDEMVALQQAYNDYSKTELKAYFNGTDVSKDSLTRSYKDASLQLMGAYVIETSEHQVDMSGLINSEEGKAFYNKYHQMFLAAKTATGDEKLEKIKEFYSAVKTDFPITQEVRTEGIAHADDYATLASYKLSVAPMIAAGEIMWQNLEVDETLDDSTIDFLNDLGLCNYAESKFGTIETISLTSESDSTNPLYEQYKSAFEKELKEKNIYVIDDEHRELSKLQEFQEAVNWHFENEESYGYSSGVVMTTSETYQEKYSWQESHTTYSSEQTRETVEASQIPDGVRNDLENQVNSEIASENEQAKQEAEKKAEETQKEMQKEEDKKAEQIEEEIKKDDQQFQDQVDKANETIDRNNSDQDTSNDEKVNESEFGGNVDFDEDHSDDNGNLDDSVENITTNGDGDQTGEELPDPNQTGAEFDQKAPSGDSSSSAEQLEEAPSTSTSGTGDETYEYEELIDQLIEQEAAQSSTETEGYQYTK